MGSIEIYFSENIFVVWKKLKQNLKLNNKASRYFLLLYFNEKAQQVRNNCKCNCVAVVQKYFFY